MHDQLSTYASLAEDYLENCTRSYDSDPSFAELIAKNMRRLEPTVKAILKRLDPDLASFNVDAHDGEEVARNAAQRGLGIIETMDILAEKLAPDTPNLPADQFHPWIWDAARTFWASKHYRAAVDAAARSINAHTQTKVGRTDIFDTDLMNQTFTDKPKPGQSYLRLPGDANDRTIQNRNRALRPFAEGCYSGIRALAAHETGPDWPEQRALESLAALSILARWIEECDVRTDP